ncbi:cilia- and flagella-associated protein 46-like isoform X2 [Pseudoliparis swirei]|uniref:cilia- and flagella-associated protein 46-like isoform X2 n=1 Tax=Pseudoliparis swirei TaxID=2059687 RepID=UPI0024BDF801|nr:cilia- and flagella-associated protein 46-like isoform X2 [Pseudoliparis swirei]
MSVNRHFGHLQVLEPKSTTNTGMQEEAVYSMFQCRRRRAQQLLAQALSEAVGLMLHHRLPSSTLAAASLDMLECQGRSDHAAPGQYFALFQSCCTVAAMAAVLSAASTGASRPSARLGPHRKLLSREERPGDTPTGAQASPRHKEPQHAMERTPAS